MKPKFPVKQRDLNRSPYGRLWVCPGGWQPNVLPAVGIPYISEKWNQQTTVYKDKATFDFRQNTWTLFGRTNKWI